jgi:hypothetical protein
VFFRAGLALLLLLLGLAIGCAGEGSGGSEEQGGGATADETEAPATPEPLTITLAEMNDSGQTGTATLTPASEQGAIETFEVAVTITPPPEDAEYAAIHAVPCDEFDPKIPPDASSEEIFEAVEATNAAELTEVRDGSSRTTVAKSIDEVSTGRFSIIVGSFTPPYQTFACGDIPESG